MTRMIRKDRRQMFSNARRTCLVAGGAAAAMAGVLGFAGTTASAEPTLPLPPQPVPAQPAPATVTQTITVQAGTPAAPLQPASPATLPAQMVGTPIAAPAAPIETIAPASSQTLTDYFVEKKVAMEPQKSIDFKALNIVLPMPTGWAQVPDPNVPDAFAVIADRVGGDGLYTSNAAVVIYKLVGEFDAKEAISHGLIDSQQLPAWRSTAASLADYGGMPSAAIEGTYRQNNLTLNTSRRHVIATSGPDRYLVTLSVTTSAQVSVAAGDATDAVVNGFKVGSPDAPPVPLLPAVLPAPAAPGVPAAPVAPAPPAAVPASSQMLGLPS